MLARDVGVVVIGRNEGERLLKCFSSLGPQADRVVYVDSGSTDGSPEAAEKMGHLVVRLDSTLPFTAARARNEGSLAARHRWPSLRYIQFLDGDCELISEWLEIAYGFMESHPNVAAVCGRRREKWPDQSIYNKLCDLEWATPVGEAIACGGDSFVRVPALEMAGGFRAELIAGEEPEMCLRLRECGWTIWRLDTEMTAHDAAMKHFRQWWIRAMRGGYGYAQVTCLHRGSRFGLWRREVRSAIIWTAGLPLFLALGLSITPIFFALLAIYPIQISRMAIKRNTLDPLSWISSYFIMLAQFAAFVGIFKFIWNKAMHRGSRIIEYKRAG